LKISASSCLIWLRLSPSPGQKEWPLPLKSFDLDVVIDDRPFIASMREAKQGRRKIREIGQAKLDDILTALPAPQIAGSIYFQQSFTENRPLTPTLPKYASVDARMQTDEEQRSQSAYAKLPRDRLCAGPDEMGVLSALDPVAKEQRRMAAEAAALLRKGATFGAVFDLLRSIAGRSVPEPPSKNLLFSFGWQALHRLTRPRMSAGTNWPIGSTNKAGTQK
jgi:hypothetical protein